MGVRVIDGPEALVITRLADKTARPGALQIIQRHFPGVAVKFELEQGLGSALTLWSGPLR